MEIKKFLEETEEKLRLINEKHRELRHLLVHLKERNLMLEEKLARQEKFIKELENKNLNLHIAKSLVEDKSNPKLMRKQIDENIRKIDKCIELLKGM